MKNSLRVPYALSVYNNKEVNRVVKVLTEHRSNIGKETLEFEKSVARYFGKEYGIMVNSGSSAILVALELLNLPKGSEIITPLLTFSTTVSPMVKLGLIPVFADVEEGKYTINVDQVEKLITRKTKALVMPLLLGNVPNMKKLQQLANKYKLYFIEDSCDTLGAIYDGKPTGTYADISATSFFGSHIITAGGNGGMVLVDDQKLRDRAKMLRGWGRTSSLFGESEDIKKRFAIKIDKIDYDAKFIFEEIGYNFMPNEMGAAFGNEQIKKLPIFRKTREYNFKTLRNFFKKYEKLFILPIQEENVKTQWLAFPLTIRNTAPFTRLQLVKFLEESNIQTRPIFTGNILKQPGFKNIPSRAALQYPVTNAVMERGFVVGVHHGLKKVHLEKITKTFEEFLSNF